jgi:hypothetical protein
MSQPTKQELIDHIESLVTKVAELIRERDEARRIACGLIYDQASSPNTTKQSIAEAEGWDCYTETHNDI